LSALGRAVLLLFDIDGTLLAGATRAHRDALYEAVREVHGVDAWALRGRSPRAPGAPPESEAERARSSRLSPAGRTDGEIARIILLDAGVSAERIDDRADAVREACCRAYVRLCPQDLSDTVLPGIGELLDWLEDRREVTLALLTGNYEPVARLKLARAGIGRHFPTGQGAFGSDAEDRAALPAIARRRAGAVGSPYARERTIVIGDTPRDIACARADQVRCFAVATGPYPVAELASADQALADARGLRTAFAAELGE
jgi:phosphoglycolate phosphatase